MILIILIHFLTASVAETGELSGKVYRKTDLIPFPGVLVELRNDKELVSTTITDVDGRFTFKSMPQGSYDLTLDFIRHRKKVIHNICISRGESLDMDILYPNTCKNSNKI